MKGLPTFRGRHAAGRRARPGEKGFTLVETLVGVMLISVVVTSVFSLVLTSKMDIKLTGNREKAIFYVRQVMDALKTYVTADTAQPGPNNWVLRNATQNDPCNCWALQPGNHNVSWFLPPAFTAAPTNGAMSYTVTDSACGTGTCKQVSFTITWND